MVDEKEGCRPGERLVKGVCVPQMEDIFVELPKLRGKGPKILLNFYSDLGCDFRTQIFDNSKVIMNRKNWFKYKSKFMKITELSKQFDPESELFFLFLGSEFRFGLPMRHRSIPEGRVKLLKGWLLAKGNSEGLLELSHDVTAVRCNRCGWTGKVKDLVHGYYPVDDDGDVEPVDECPACGSDDWDEIE